MSDRVLANPARFWLAKIVKTRFMSLDFGP